MNILCGKVKFSRDPKSVKILTEKDTKNGDEFTIYEGKLKDKDVVVKAYPKSYAIMINGSNIQEEFTSLEDVDKYLDKEGMELNFSNSKNFNAVNSKLNPKIDGFLQDVAQFSGKIDYSDIMKFEPTKDQITDLSKLMIDCESLFEDGADEEDPEVIKCFDKVVKIVRGE